jgi:hypothetical protein
MSFLLLNPTRQKKFENLVKSAGGVLYYDARKDLIQANGVTPDRSGQGNNVTWNNFAGTGTSGLVVENGKVFRRFDGTDDFGSMVNTASIDITSAPLAVFATIRIPSTATGFMYLFSKNLDASANEQYGLLFSNTTNKFMPYLEGEERGISEAITKDVFVNIGYVWDGAATKNYINLITNGTDGVYSGLLTSRPNARIGRRETASAHLKGDLATISIYTGAKATKSNILKAEAALSNGYI